MKKLLFLAAALISLNAFSQTFSSEGIPWYSGKQFPFEGHVGSRLKYDHAIKKIRYTEFNPSSQTNWFNFSTIMQGGGSINFITHQGYDHTPQGMASDGTFDPDQFVKNYTKMVIDRIGRVGIGTQNPLTQLHVNGGNLFIENKTPYMGSHTNDSRILFGNAAFFLSGQQHPDYTGFEFSRRLRIGQNFSSYSSNAFHLLVPGSGLIGRLSVEHKLFVGTKNSLIANNSMGDFMMVVDGKLGAREIEVKTGSWADYVFNPEYKLKSLNEVENFILNHKHLPNVPSESQVIEQGFSVSEMAKIQMEKIEELTLYTIQQQKLIDELIQRMKKMESSRE